MVFQLSAAALAVASASTPLVTYPNGAQVPVEPIANQVARANHLAAKPRYNKTFAVNRELPFIQPLRDPNRYVPIPLAYGAYGAYGAYAPYGYGGLYGYGGVYAPLHVPRVVVQHPANAGGDDDDGEWRGR